MDTQNTQARRLIFWNRFWLVLASLYALSIGYDFLHERLVNPFLRLHLSWGSTDTPKQERALVFSTNQGPSFVVTHLVRSPTTGFESAVATLPRPLFIPHYEISGIKTRRYITVSELSKLVWVEESGQKASAPKHGEPVKALYYEVMDVTTTE